MDTPHRVVVAVRAETDVAHAVGRATNFCTRHGLPALLGAQVATAASELANNLWMHSRDGGQIVLSLLQPAGVELVAEDDGPGIADIALALSEGWSTGGGLGCGLPGVRRLMDEFSIDSAPGRGTRVVARKWLQRRP